jgi:1,4-dihydroxy-2-naphthoate octaprenyltransferase
MLLPVGLIIVDFLEIIYLLNIEKDRLIGKQTLAVIPGKRFAKGEYLFCILVAFAVAGQLALIFSALFLFALLLKMLG